MYSSIASFAYLFSEGVVFMEIAEGFCLHKITRSHFHAFYVVDKAGACELDDPVTAGREPGTLRMAVISEMRKIIAP